ncbi:SDR family NAD(P)-dependent oxidoreductase [Panacagrimonas sp.]|uniref:SDR family NAD(P)-dependent oxidoreductase n=1 Tax=Panacagrimonas sp. TaxID=2480088 RepID=UPI003B51927B
MTRSSFQVFGLVPADLSHAGLALAVARAGGTALLDLEFAASPARALTHFERLLAGTDGRVGLRVGPSQVALARALIALAQDRALCVVLTGPATELRRLREAVGLRDGDTCLAEILAAEDAEIAASICDGLLARGHEAGGWVSEDSSFILLQKLHGRVSTPVYIQGGIGVRTAAACRVAGAAGVVLDDCLLLMAESPLSAALQQDLSRLNGAECKLFGELIGRPCRAFARPGSPALKAAEELQRGAEGGELELEDWIAQTQASLGWGGQGLLPLGQGIGLAAQYRDTYRHAGRLVQAVRRASLAQMDKAAGLGALNENAPLARSHGTRYPLAQGPMTRVSDSPAFAVDVAKAGALPFLALALMRGPQVAQMLEQTRAQIGDLPWGVGMLGFVPHALREEQCAEIWKCKPGFALIAGGRPDQAAEFESRGIPTYIHAPAPALLKMYLEQGARRFVFEGRECGGHVGPLGSFPLWEQMIEVLLAHVPAGEDKKIHILFAGGVHDAQSGAMVAALAAPLAERGMKVGALMGTAYLFTQEIVSSGAVVEGFQAEALRCRRTLNLESGPGHASRCVDTQFAHDFYDTRRRLIREGKSAEEIREVLEDLNLGRLRIASKGVDRDDTGRVVDIAPEQQRADGMYMIGQVATLRDHVVPVAQLHDDVCAGSQRALERLAQDRMERALDAQPSDIAIVGVGITLPKADSADDYWKLILDKHCVIREVHKERWDSELYFDADRKARDKVYSKWGGFLDEVPFDPLRFGIPPKSMKSIDPLQLLTLETAARTLADAGYADGQFDRENTSVILGASGGAGDLGVQYSMRAELPRFVENLTPDVWERLPEWTEESFAGTLLNVAAGRVANRLDFGGVNMTVDAACGSSLAAISIAVHELETGRSSLVLAGGFDTTQSMFGYTAFAKTQALSAKGQPRTFDQNADGIAISEGVAMIALKRLADAERDGDRIYAVIKSASGSSDGRALGMTAPRTEGQVRALKRAYRKAGFSPATLGLVEAHGTGTPVGDRTEAQTIAHTLNEAHAAPRSVAIGSVKTLIGHTKAAAGVSGLIKVALALHHRVLPAHHGVDQPIDTVASSDSPVYLLKDARPWVAHPDHPRRACASAFGFGGANFHAVLEEYGGGAGPSGGNRWPAELCLWRAADVPALVRELEKVLPHVQAGSRLRLGELANALARQAELRPAAPVALAVVATDLKSLAADLAAAIAHLQGGTKPLPPSVRFGKSVPAQSPPVAFLFPGQGAQYLNMGREAALYLPEIREALELADRVLADDFRAPLSTRILPASAFDPDTEAAQAAALTDTRVAQPAIGTLALGYLRLAERLGLEAVASAGHSYGEYAALMAAGVLDPADFLRLSAVRGRAMGAAARSTEPGGMAAVQGRRERVAALVKDFPGVRVANHNAPEQSVISGPKAAVEQAAAKLSSEGLRASLLPVSGAFHTELVAPAKAPLSAAIHATPFKPARFPVYSNSSGTAYPADPEAMQNLLDGHLLSSVEFVTEIETMYAAGCRVFLELGPKGICTGMARQTLVGRDAVAVSLDASGGGMRGLLSGLAELFVAGVRFDSAVLFADRELRALDLGKLADAAAPTVYPKHWWMLSGGCARPIDDPIVRTGKLPALTRETAAAAREALNARLLAEARASLPPAASAIAAPTVAGPAASPAVQPVNALSNEALVAYQQTMRQFLALQERVVQQFLGGAPLPGVGTAVSMPNPAPAPVVRPSAPAPTSATAAPPVPASNGPAPTARPAALEAPAPRLDLRASLLDIVAERTGYPAEMLALDADMEADLGIDSIKRVEIFGALRKALPESTAQAMQQAMERLTRARSLQAVLHEVEALAPVTAPPAAPAPPREAPAATPTAARAFDGRSLLLDIVAERTGYPVEMLALDADMEADLGIDSIKRVEILGALQKSLPPEVAARVQEQMERLTKARSLQAILQVLGEHLAAPVAMPATAPTRPLQAAAALDGDHDPAAVRSKLLQVVAERTGYPVEMLDLDADLEADLGIDSIKRVEVLGALQNSLEGEWAEAVRGRMERLTQARSLQAVLSELSAVRRLPRGEGQTRAKPPAGAAPAPAASVPVKADFQTLLLQVVADRTGYPVEMLGLEADLEADLGIDSIKRVEILGAFQKAVPAAAATVVQAGMERLTKARSLQAILAVLRGPGSTVAAPNPPATTAVAISTAVHAGAGAVSADGRNAAPLPRYVIKSVAAPLNGKVLSLQGLALVLGARDAITREVCGSLKARGLTPVAVAATEPAALQQAIAEARHLHGPVRALVHLHGLGMQTAKELAAWRGLYRRDLLSLFHALQATLDDLPQARVIGVSRLGGSFGRDAVGRGQPVAGGVNGMLNCLRAEVPGCIARAVDFDGQSDAEVIRLLVEEILAEDHAPEAGYIGLERFGSATLAQPLAPSPFPPHVTPEADWVLLATGGARGITAEILHTMVCPGMQMILLGRTAEPGPEPVALSAHADAAALRRALLAERVARGEKPRPVEIDREVQRLLVDREIRLNLARLRRAGAKVRYLACDVRDEAALGQLLDELYTRHGRIDAVIHGAGVIEDKRLADKTAESFERVLGTKLDPAFVFARKLRPQTLKLLAFFTSVAGRYGNLGQTDYAAANEALNRLAWELQRQWTQTRVVSVNWGPWDAGMASDGVKRAMRERGMEPIDIAAGCRFFRDELAYGPRHDVELVAGQGPWGEVSAGVSADAAPRSEQAARYPLVRRVPRIGVGGALTLEHRLCLADDPYLADHVIDGKAVLPMAGALEYMAQFVAAGWPEWKLAELRDLRLFSGLVLDGDQGHCDIVLRARAATHSEPGVQAVTVEIADTRHKGNPNYRATAVLMQDLPLPIAPMLDVADAMETLDVAQTYDRVLFHGARFRSLTSLRMAMQPPVADAALQASTPQGFLSAADAAASWLFDPALIDVAPQLAFIWAARDSQAGALPNRMGCVQRFGEAPIRGELQLRLRAQAVSAGGGFEYEAEFVDASGKVRLAIREGESTISAALGRLSPGNSASAAVAPKPGPRR